MFKWNHQQPWVFFSLGKYESWHQRFKQQNFQAKHCIEKLCTWPDLLASQCSCQRLKIKIMFPFQCLAEEQLFTRNWEETKSRDHSWYFTHCTHCLDYVQSDERLTQTNVFKIRYISCHSYPFNSRKMDMKETIETGFSYCDFLPTGDSGETLCDWLGLHYKQIQNFVKN